MAEYNKIKKSLLLILLAVPALVRGGVESVGTTSANFLKIPAHARPAAMGEAYTALSDDEGGMMYNPAGLARATRNEISATHIEWFQGISLEHLGGLMNLGKLGVIGASLTWLQVGDMARTERTGNGPDPLANFIQTGTFNPQDMALALAYSRLFAKRYYAGLKLTTVRQAIDTDSGLGFGVDAGIQVKDILDGLDVGAMITNAGSKIGVGNTSFTQPLMFNVGAALSLFQRRWLISADVEIPLDNKVELALGTEFHVAEPLFLRAGWRGGFAEQFNFGGGMMVAMFKLDYAYSPFSQLGSTHRLTATYRWGIPGLALGVAQKLLAPLGYKRYQRTAFLPLPDRPQMIKSWKLNVVDESGQVVKTWQGEGRPPEAQPWDGRDVDGRILPDQRIRGRMTTVFLGGGSRDAQSEEVELDSTPPQLNLDVEPKVVRPRGGEAVLIPATIKLSAKDENNISVWLLTIKDESGQVFWRRQGQGTPPASIVWDGTNAEGKYVSSGKTYVMQLSSKDGPGNLAVSEPVAQIVLLREIKIQIASDALFSPGKADVKISAYHQLKEVVAMIRKHWVAGETVQIEGHTDNTPVVHSVYQSNTLLSLARAKAVIKFMEDLLGMEQNVLVPRGYGETRPIASNQTQEGRLANRRVEVRIQFTSYE